MHITLSVYVPLSYPAGKRAKRNFGEYLTSNSRQHLDSPSKLISFWYLPTNCTWGWKTLCNPTLNCFLFVESVWWQHHLDKGAFDSSPVTCSTPCRRFSPLVWHQPSAAEAGAKQENHFPIKQQPGYWSHCRKDLSNTAASRTVTWHVYSSEPVLGCFFFMRLVL